MILKGKVWKYGRDIDTDVIIPARYLTTSDPAELGQHCLEDLDPDFIKKVEEGDIIMADENFGCGSSREHAPISIKAAGVDAVIAKSFARIFYRNAINTGLPIFEARQAVEESSNGDILEIDTSSGQIKNITKEKIYQAEPFPEFIEEIIETGGLIPYLQEKLKNTSN